MEVLPKVEEMATEDLFDELFDADFQSDSDSEDEDSNTFEIRDGLPPPQERSYTTEQLHSMIHDSEINLEAEYQRDVVWPEAKQIGLIDSIFRNFYIPPVLLAVQGDGDEVVRFCVDGKQRLTSIVNFMGGQIPHRDLKTKKNFWYTVPESSRGVKAEVPERFKTIFAEKTIKCYEYVDLKPTSERELFQRVQLGMTLTVAEKLQAISSPWTHWIRELETSTVHATNGLHEKLQFDIKRSRDFQNIAHMVFCCHGLPDQLSPTTQKIERWISRMDEPEKQFKEDVKEIFKTWLQLTSHETCNEGFTKIPQRISPVEFIFIGVLLYQLRGQSLDNQGRAIYILRHTVRREFKDIRNNSTVGKSLWHYINLLKVNPTAWITNTEAVPSKGKRKWKEENDEEYLSMPPDSPENAVKARAKRSKLD